MGTKKAFVILLVAALLTACTKDKTPAPAPTVFTCNSAVTYTAVVKQIIDVKCAYNGCHSFISPPAAGGINLDNYNDCKALGEAGILMCTIKHDTCGYKAMPFPPGSPRISDSLIVILDCWVANGMP